MNCKCQAHYPLHLQAMHFMKTFLLIIFLWFKNISKFLDHRNLKLYGIYISTYNNHKCIKHIYLRNSSDFFQMIYQLNHHHTIITRYSLTIAKTRIAYCDKHVSKTTVHLVRVWYLSSSDSASSKVAGIALAQITSIFSKQSCDQATWYLRHNIV